ncbi:MAG: hypothetical protein EBU42_07060, partial [Synechococcus sp.]|nr:hypothetical protein [Synechococcus sp.]
WLADAKLMELWQQSQRPLKLLGGALSLLLVLQLTSAVLGTLDAIPMLPRLLQLTGLIYLVPELVSRPHQLWTRSWDRVSSPELIPWPALPPVVNPMGVFSINPREGEACPAGLGAQAWLVGGSGHLEVA